MSLFEVSWHTFTIQFAWIHIGILFQLAYEDPDKKVFHLCIVNLVIGTLYCAKGNYEFGISRVIKSLEPYNKKLGTDTWFYAKRCFLSLIENLAKVSIPHIKQKIFLSFVHNNTQPFTYLVIKMTLWVTFFCTHDSSAHYA